MIYKSNIYYSKVYHKGTWKDNSSPPYFVMWQGIIYKKSACGSRAGPCLVILFQIPILIRKCQKRSLNWGTLVPAPLIYQTKCSFFVFFFKLNGFIYYQTSPMLSGKAFISAAKALSKLIFLSQSPWWRYKILYVHWIPFIVLDITRSCENWSSRFMSW